MTIGRSNSVASDTRSSVAWKVERVPNSGKSCFGRTSREAGHSRVPAPPHMISGIIRLSISFKPCFFSNAVVAAMPRDKFGNAVRNRGLRLQPGVAQEIADIGKSRRHVTGLHRQHVLYGGTAQLLLEKGHHIHQVFRVLVADIVDPRRRSPGLSGNGNMIDQTQYYTAGIIDMGEIPPHSAMVKKLD